MSIYRFISNTYDSGFSLRLYLIILIFYFIPSETSAQKGFNLCGKTKIITIAELKKCPRLLYNNDSLFKVVSMVINYHLYGQDYSEFLFNGVIKPDIIATFERHQVKSFTLTQFRARMKGTEQAYPVKTPDVYFDIIYP